MSTIQDAIKSVQDYGGQFTKALERHRGFLGDGDGTVYVADRDGYVYIRHRQAESADITGTMEPEEVIYSRSDIPPIEGYPVIFGRDIDTEDFQLLAADSQQLLGWIFDKYIKDHHEQHEFNEYDTVWIQKQAMLPLLVYPTSPVSTSVNVYGGWYQWDTDWHYFETTSSSELSAYVPVQAGRARFLLICIDGETEALHYESGDTFLEYISPRDCEDRIPPPPEGKIPLAAIYLVVGETSFDWDTIYDVRLLFSGGGSMSTGSAPRDASFVTMGLNDTLSDERVLTAGTGIVVTDNGANDTVVVSLDDHDHAGDMSGDGGIIPGTSVELPEIPVAIYDDVTDWFNTTQSAGCLSGGAITDNGDGTIDVAAGNGYIKIADDKLAGTRFFDYPAAGPLTPTDNAKNWVYIDYSAGTPVAKITDDKTILNRNTMFTIARLYREGNTLHILEKGQCAYNLSMRTHRMLVDVFHYQRSSGLITAEKNARYLTVTTGCMFRGLNHFDTTAIDTTLSGDSFTFYYRDGIGGWTTGTASQIDNVNYDDGDGVLGTVSPNQYGVFWIYVDFDSHLYVQYGQDSYKLAAAQESCVPDPPDLLDGFAILVARIIVERDGANLQEIAYPWEEIFMPQAATDHNQLGNLQGGSGPDEYYHLDLNAYEELSAGAGALPNVAGAGYALRSDGVNSWEVALAPLWGGTHRFSEGLRIDPAKGIYMGDESWIGVAAGAERIVFDDAGDIAVMGANFGVGTLGPAGLVHIYGETGTTELIIDCQGDTNDEQSAINLITKGDGTKDLGHADTLGWHIAARGNTWTTAGERNDLWFHYWDGSSYDGKMALDHTGLLTLFNGLSFDGLAGDNEIFVLDNESIALELLDVGGLEYLRINSEDVNPYFLIDPAGAGIKVGIGTATPSVIAVLHVEGGALFRGGTNAFYMTTTDFVVGVQGSALELIMGAATGNTTSQIRAYTVGSTAYGNLILQTGGGFVGITKPVPIYKLDVYTSHAGGYAGYFFNDGNHVNRYGIGIQCGEDADAGTLIPIIFRDGDDTASGYITVVNGVPAFVNRSDASLKNDIQDTKKKGLETITGLRIRDFRWKTCPDMELTTGFVAQEVELVMPEAASEREGLKGVAMGMFMPMVVKAIQELTVRIEQLELQ